MKNSISNHIKSILCDAYGVKETNKYLLLANRFGFV